MGVVGSCSLACRVYGIFIYGLAFQHSHSGFRVRGWVYGIGFKVEGSETHQRTVLNGSGSSGTLRHYLFLSCAFKSFRPEPYVGQSRNTADSQELSASPQPIHRQPETLTTRISCALTLRGPCEREQRPKQLCRSNWLQDKIS